VNTILTFKNKTEQITVTCYYCRF